MMSPSGSIVASLENVNGFLAVYTPSDDLIRIDFEQKGVIPEVMLHILEEFVFLLGRHSLNNEISCMEENPTEQSRLQIFLSKEIFEGGMIRFNTLFGEEEWGIFLKKMGHRPGYLRKVFYESSIEAGMTKKATDTLYSDREIMCDPEREVGYGITDLWDEIVETLHEAPVSTNTELGGYVREFESRVRQDMDEIYTRLDDEQTERQPLAGRLNMLFRDRRAHAHTHLLMEAEARMSREAWTRAIDACDLVHGEHQASPGRSPNEAAMVSRVFIGLMIGWEKEWNFFI
uniref:Uncharacterized protein n=1 Tax=Tanacetum cinerariifolium TaxID=118510 RepID=A0A6L2K192_TANCI|nr:hypothetical protein [Tanacetum cinerariifolium]